jgi:hypothetical protein
MSTTTAPCTAITEADVVAFLAAAAYDLSSKVGGQYCSINVKISQHSIGTCGFADPGVTFTTYVHQDVHREAPSLAEAMAASISACSPEVIRATLRARAAALIAEADAITITSAAPASASAAA